MQVAIPVATFPHLWAYFNPVTIGWGDLLLSHPFFLLHNLKFLREKIEINKKAPSRDVDTYRATHRFLYRKA